LDFQKTISLRTQGNLAFFGLVTVVFNGSLEINLARSDDRRERDHIPAAKLVNSILKKIILFFPAHHFSVA